MTTMPCWTRVRCAREKRSNAAVNASTASGASPRLKPLKNCSSPWSRKPDRDGHQRREAFDRNKLLRSLRVACQKRPISEETLQDIADDIERTLTNRLDKEVPSAEIGEMVMEHLRRIDQVAYVRFASVYRQFEDATQFRDIVNLLKKQGGRLRKE